MRVSIIILFLLLTGFTGTLANNEISELMIADTSLRIGDDIMLGLPASKSYKTIKFFGFRAPAELAGSLGSIIKIKKKKKTGTSICISLQKSGKKVWVINVEKAIHYEEIVTFKLEENHFSGAY